MNGTGIPDVDFDVGESYAGLLPIGDANDPNQLYFWFFPSTNPAAEKEIAIWLTGGVRKPLDFTRRNPWLTFAARLRFIRRADSREWSISVAARSFQASEERLELEQTD